MNQEYQNYLRSYQWNDKRNERLQIDGYKCAICGNSEQQLNVHHLTYKNIMQEDVENDLITLCRPCHTMLHRIQMFSSVGYQNYRSAQDQFKEPMKAAVLKKICDQAIVEIWQRDKSTGGDCRIFDSGAGMIGKLTKIL